MLPASGSAYTFRFLQGLQQALERQAQDKQQGLEQLKQLSGQQQALHAQLTQADQEHEASTRQLERLHKENMTLQVSLMPHGYSASPRLHNAAHWLNIGYFNQRLGVHHKYVLEGTSLCNCHSRPH